MCHNQSVRPGTINSVTGMKYENTEEGRLKATGDGKMCENTGFEIEL